MPYYNIAGVSHWLPWNSLHGSEPKTGEMAEEAARPAAMLMVRLKDWLAHNTCRSAVVACKHDRLLSNHWLSIHRLSVKQTARESNREAHAAVQRYQCVLCAWNRLACMCKHMYGNDTGTGKGTDAGTDKDTDPGTDAGTDSDTHTCTDTQVGTDTGTDKWTQLWVDWVQPHQRKTL